MAPQKTTLSILEHPPNFPSILHKKLFFSILHTHFYKTPTSVYLFYPLFYLNNHFSHFFIIILSQTLSLNSRDSLFQTPLYSNKLTPL